MEVSSGLDARRHVDTALFSVEIEYARKRKRIRSGPAYGAVGRTGLTEFYL
jgi:hypothetical protein